MNRIPKLVVSRSMTDFSGWESSSPLKGDLFEAVREQKARRDVIVTGSTSVLHALARRDGIDEYRVLVFPAILGGGTRLFETDAALAHLHLASVEKRGAAAMLRYERTAVAS
jgi:dihydrofolate reductase